MRKFHIVERKREVADAVKSLRLGLGHTQQSFANALGLGISTVVRYESSRPPRGAELSQFIRLAMSAFVKEEDTEKKKAFGTCATTLVKATNEELGVAARTVPVSMDESQSVEVLLTVMRNLHLPGMADKYRRIRQELGSCFEEVGRAEESGLAVLLVDSQVRSDMKTVAEGYWAKKDKP